MASLTHGHEFEQTMGDSERQGSLACCSPWGCRVRHDLVTEQLHEAVRKEFRQQSFEDASEQAEFAKNGSTMLSSSLLISGENR